MSKINRDVLEELNEMVGKMDRACAIYRDSKNLAKKLNVEMPAELNNKINRLANMSTICEKVYYFYTSKDDILFGDWITLKDQPTLKERKISINLLNQYRALKNEVGSVEYFIPDELCRK